MCVMISGAIWEVPYVDDGERPRYDGTGCATE